MNVARPEAFGLLFLLVPIVLVAVNGYRRGTADLERLGGRWQRENLSSLFMVKWFFSTFFYVLGFAFGTLALAGISWGERPVEETRSGMDIAFLVDVSRSMLAKDIPPSRLERAGDVMRGVVQEFSGSRFSLVAFKGRAVRLVPLTEDIHAVEAVIEALSPDLMSSAGTDLDAGIRAAIESFPEKMDRNRAIVAFTDGEYLSGLPYASARRAGTAGIPIFLVGAGSEAGSEIVLPDGTVVTDEDGRPVVSSLKAGVLAEIAEASAGGVFLLSDPQIVSRLSEALSGFERESTSTGFRLEPVPRYRMFLMISLVCFLIYIAIRVVKWKKAF